MTQRIEQIIAAMIKKSMQHGKIAVCDVVNACTDAAKEQRDNPDKEYVLTYVKEKGEEALEKYLARQGDTYDRSNQSE